MVRIILPIVLVILVVAGFAACSEDDDEDPLPDMQPTLYKGFRFTYRKPFLLWYTVFSPAPDPSLADREAYARYWLENMLMQRGTGY